MKLTAWSDSNSVPTTTSPSRSVSANCMPVTALCCGALRTDGATHDVEQGEYRFDGWRLDRRSRRLTDPQERPAALSKGEYALLLAFLDAPERPLSREYLLQATRLHEDIFDRSIDIQVLRLRRKLEMDPKAPRVIRTERGVGYVFAIPVEQNRCADWRSIPQNR
jgi:DNA-binding response OmpR family regulator